MRNSSSVIHKFEEVKKEKIEIKKAVFFLVLIAFFGALSGFFIATLKKKTSFLTTTERKTEKKIKKAGVFDTKTFPDKAEGILKKGGIDGEGEYHLERPGGESQNVYLTSSTIDLSHFVGKKVRVWGKTFAGQKAGWLMDVGYIEVL